jgi:hypothetical protein
LIPPNGTELSTRDVPASWLQQSYGTPPSIPVPLSDLGYVYSQVTFPYGVKSATLRVPIAKDSTAENNESMACEIYDAQMNATLTLIGTVPKHS